MRGLRTIPVLEDFARDMEEVCPDALVPKLHQSHGHADRLHAALHRASRPWACATACRSAPSICWRSLDMEDKLEGRQRADRRHQPHGMAAWTSDGQGRQRPVSGDPEAGARRRTLSEKHNDMVRFDYIHSLGYYCTESSEHNAEYNPFYIKTKYPELIEQLQHSPGRVSPPLCEPDQGLERREARTSSITVR